MTLLWDFILSGFGDASDVTASASWGQRRLSTVAWTHVLPAQRG